MSQQPPRVHVFYSRDTQEISQPVPKKLLSEHLTYNKKHYSAAATIFGRVFVMMDGLRAADFNSCGENVIIHNGKIPCVVQGEPVLITKELRYDGPLTLGIMRDLFYAVSEEMEYKGPVLMTNPIFSAYGRTIWVKISVYCTPVKLGQWSAFEKVGGKTKFIPLVKGERQEMETEMASETEAVSDSEVPLEYELIPEK